MGNINRVIETYITIPSLEQLVNYWLRGNGYSAYTADFTNIRNSFYQMYIHDKDHSYKKTNKLGI